MRGRGLTFSGRRKRSIVFRRQYAHMRQFVALLESSDKVYLVVQVNYSNPKVATAITVITHLALHPESC